jgi:predicted O-methyltransferase YrrM
MKYNTHDWKGFLINDLISDLNYKSYLELGVSVGESWKLIYCENKIGVDNNINVANEFDGVIHATTDDYFLNNKDKFDLIYIDALHEKNQVYKDFKNSFNSLNDSGIIITKLETQINI